MLRLRAIHGLSALLLGTFLALHIANHLIGISGEAAHLHAMAALRPLYRNVLIEPLLLALLAWQMTSGVVMIIRGWRRTRDPVTLLQRVSGLYLALFLVVHVTAVLSGRAASLDTDFHFAAAGFHVPGWSWFFAPYYSLAVAALFTHIGCAISWRVPTRYRPAIVGGMVTLGVAVALLITASLAGLLYPVEIPQRYTAPYTTR